MVDDGQISEGSDIDFYDGGMDSLFIEMNNGWGTCLQAMTQTTGTSAASRATGTKAISSDMQGRTFAANLPFHLHDDFHSKSVALD